MVSILVEVVIINMGDILFSYNIMVILEVKEEVFVVVCVFGIIEYIFVEEGDYVEKG